ncbi:hypothetical protein Tco_0363870 [Tanacetum coccineum]
MMEKVTVQPGSGENKLLMLMEQQENTHLVQVVPTKGRKGLVILLQLQRGGVIIAKQCTKPKRKRVKNGLNVKVLLVLSQQVVQALSRGRNRFLADPRNFLKFNLLDSHHHNVLINRMIWMPMTLIVMNSNSAKIALMESIKEWLDAS